MEDLSETVQETAKASFSLALSNLISNVSLAIATILIGALLGASNYGLYSLAVATPAFLTSVVDFGLAFSLLNFCSKGKRKDSFNYLFNASFVTLLVALIITSLSALFSNFVASKIINRPEASLLVAVASISILFGAIVNLLTYFFVGIGEPKKAAVSQATLGVTKGLAQILLVVFGLSVLGAVLGHVFGTIFAAIMSILLLLKISQKVNLKVDLNQLRGMLNYGIPIYASTFIISFMSQYQASLIGELSTNFSAGNYKMALNFSVLVSMVATPIATALVPAFSKINSERYKESYEALIKYTSLIILPISLAVIMFSKEGIALLLGEGYSQAAFFLSLMIFLYLLSPIGGLVVYSFLNGIGETRTSFILNALNAALFILLARTSMIKYGIAGMIVASLISSFISLIVSIIYLKIKYDTMFNALWALKIYLVSSVSVVVALLTIWFVGSNNNLLRLIIGGSIFFFTFLTFVPLLKVLDSRDIELFRKLAKGKFIHLLFDPFISYEEKLVKVVEKLS
jgi:O-antigen/teichoic acid export membrane protein